MDLQSYDEDLWANPFFVKLQQDNPTLYSSASKREWLVCISALTIDSEYFPILPPLIDFQTSEFTIENYPRPRQCIRRYTVIYDNL